MSTKNLARTALEKGRSESFKRRASKEQRSERRQTRNRLAQWYRFEDTPSKDRKNLSKRGNQLENLAPLWKWVRSRVGQPWSLVHSEFCSKCPINSLAGYHITVQHFLKDVEYRTTQFRLKGKVPSSRWGSGCYVDNDGILQLGKPPTRYRPTPKLRHSYEEVREWAQYRKVISRGSKLFWGIPLHSVVFKEREVETRLFIRSRSAPSRQYTVPPSGRLFSSYYDYAPVGNREVVKVNTQQTYRQGPEFSSEDYRFFSELDKSQTTALLKNDLETLYPKRSFKL